MADRLARNILTHSVTCLPNYEALLRAAFQLKPAAEFVYTNLLVQKYYGKERLCSGN